MKFIGKILFVTAVAALLFVRVAFGQQSEQPFSADHVLTVGVAENDPFDMKTGGIWEGFCIDLWQSIAADVGLKYRYVEYPTFADLLKAVEHGEVDMGAEAVTVTSDRLNGMDFSLPFLQGGLQIMVNENRSNSLLKLWNGLRDGGHLKIFGLAFGLILLATFLLTLGERHWNREFPAGWSYGLAESFYHVMSIAMTGKSSHKELPGRSGKVLAAFWLAFGVGVVAYITSSITSVMTVQNLHAVINGPKDLPGHKVAVVRGSVSESYCRDANLETIPYGALSDAVTALVRHEVDAVVSDAMRLQWYDNSHPELPITEVGPIFEKNYYALPFSQGFSPSLRHDLSVAITKRRESGYIESLRKHYFGDIQ